MKIGLTFDLKEEYEVGGDVPADAVGEFDTEEGIEILEDALAARGDEVVRIGNVRKLAAFLAAGQRVDLVFNMAEGLGGRSREAQVPSLLEAYQIPYVGSDPLTMALCLDKALSKILWRAAGIPTPDFTVVPGPSELDRGDGLPPLPLFVKPLYEGTSKGIDPASVVETWEALEARVAWTVRTYRQPALVEAFLSRREFSVGILGTGAEAEVFGVTELDVPRPYGVLDYEEKHRWDYETTAGVFTPVPSGPMREQLADLSLRVYRSVGCRDLGRVDLRCDAAGAPYVLEINPIVGLHPTGSVMPVIAAEAGMDLETLIGKIVDHTLTRHKKEVNPYGIVIH